MTAAVITIRIRAFSRRFYPKRLTLVNTRAGPIYSNIRILVRKISIRSLNQYSELRVFFSTYVTFPERGSQTISVSDTKQRRERGGGRIDILFTYTL